MDPAEPSAGDDQTTPSDPGAVTLAERRYVGQTLASRYRLVNVLGRGGMGSVFLARHVALGRPIAVKILNAGHLTERVGSTRLFREAQTAAGIGHPNIIQVLDVGATDLGDPYLVMEYLEGEDLAHIIQRKGALSLAATCRIVEAVLLALKAAHTHSVVHRDLKPANIYLVRREGAEATVKLIDFGIAKRLGPGDAEHITQPGALVGTPSYMSPEQVHGVEDVDTRADLYALGVTVYMMLTGTVPFVGKTFNETLAKVLHEEPPDPVSPLEELPKEVRTLLKRALEKDPKDRFQSAEAMLDAFRRLDAWTERNEAFAELADDLEVRAPLLTPESGEDTTPVPSRLPVLSFEATRPDGVARDLQETVAEAPTRRRRRNRLGAVVAAALLVVAGVAAFVASETATDSEAGAGPAPTSVIVHVTGVPEGATILYDGKQMGENPFSVPYTDTIMAIRVEAPGHEPFSATLVPNRNTSVRATLPELAERGALEPSTLPSEDSPAASSKPAAGEPPVTQTPPKQKVPTKKTGIGKSARGTFYSEDFE